MTGVRLCKNRLMGVAVSVGVALSASLAGAQTLPNFSGTWEPVSSSDPTAPAITQTVTHTNDTLTIGHASSGGGHRFVYKTDGRENHSALESHESLITSVAKVSVKGDTLTIARVDKYPDGRIRENTQVWSLNPAGNLVIEATDGLSGEAPVTRKHVYKKRVLLKH
jgi:hypothetical protein